MRPPSRKHSRETISPDYTGAPSAESHRLAPLASFTKEVDFFVPLRRPFRPQEAQTNFDHLAPMQPASLSVCVYVCDSTVYAGVCTRNKTCGLARSHVEERGQQYRWIIPLSYRRSIDLNTPSYNVLELVRRRESTDIRPTPVLSILTPSPLV